MNIKKIPEWIKKTTLIFLGLRAITVFLGYYAFVKIPQSSHALARLSDEVPAFLRVWPHWDSIYYLEIAEMGYHNRLLPLFFPLYPNLIHLVGYILPFYDRYVVAGLLISTLCAYLASLFFYKLVREDFSDDISLRSVFYMLIFPSAIFLFSIYTESLFLFLTVASFYYARKEKWLLVGLFGFLAALTRLQGIILLVPLAYEYFYSKQYSFKKIRGDVLWLAMIPLGLVSYGIALYLKKDNFWAFLDAYNYGWPERSEIKLNIFQTLTTKLQYTANHFSNILVNENFFGHFIDLAFFAFFLVFIILSYKKIRPSYLVCAVSLMIIPIFSGTFDSISRYVVSVFPIYIFVSIITEKYPWRQRLYEFGCIGLYFLYLFSFVNSFWVA